MKDVLQSLTRLYNIKEVESFSAPDSPADAIYPGSTVSVSTRRACYSGDDEILAAVLANFRRREEV